MTRFLILDEKGKPQNRNLAEHLEFDGNEVVEFADITHVFKLLEGPPCFDALILDIAPEQIFGMAVIIDAIRRDWPSLPIILFTRLKRKDETVQKAINVGVTGYVNRADGPKGGSTLILRIVARAAAPSKAT